MAGSMCQVKYTNLNHATRSWSPYSNRGIRPTNRISPFRTQHASSSAGRDTHVISLGAHATSVRSLPSHHHRSGQWSHRPIAPQAPQHQQTHPAHCSSRNTLVDVVTRNVYTAYMANSTRSIAAGPIPPHGLSSAGRVMPCGAPQQPACCKSASAGCYPDP